MSRPYKIFTLFILILLIFSIFNVKIPVLFLKNIDTSQILFVQKVHPGDEFTVQWMHSVELQPWEEIFRIGKQGEIILDRTRFKSFGAGVPDSAGKKQEIKDGYVVFSEIHQKFSDITYGISHYAKHTFSYKNYKLKLYEHMKDGDSVQIYTKKIPAVSYISLRIANGKTSF